MKASEKKSLLRKLETLVGHRYNINVPNFLNELIMACLGTNNEVQVIEVKNEDLLRGEDNRFDFIWGNEISGSIWFLKTNNPNKIFITEVGID